MSIIDDAVLKSIEKNLGHIVENYDVRSKPFDLKTELLSTSAKKIIKETYEKSVKDLNEVSTLLEGAARNPDQSGRSSYRDLKKDEQRLITQSFLMANFLENVDDQNSTLTMDSLSYMRLSRDWGTFDEWQQDFLACALNSRSGFVVTCYSSLLKKYMNFCVDSDMGGIPPGCETVISVCTFDSFYTKDYINKKDQYVRAMMKEISWDTVEDRIKSIEKKVKKD